MDIEDEQMYVYYNPNPRQRHTGDCTVRAVSKALGISWETAYIDLVMEGYSLADMPSSNLVMQRYLRTKGFSKHVIPDTCPDCYTFAEFAEDHPKGTYIVCTGTHVATIIDSVLWDSWNSSDEILIFYYKRD